MPGSRAIVVGAGMGGLVAALELAAQGLDVTLLERGAAPGGKLRTLTVGGRPVDSGPTVLTLREVFDDVFAAAGSRLEDHLDLQPAEILARHAWDAERHLDLFADPQRSAEAIATLAGAAEGRRFRRFIDEAQRIYQTLEHSFIRAERPSPAGLVRRAGFSGLGGLWRIRPFATLWQALEQSFHDPRLRQLFGRYATYCGSSPFQAPATLMLVAHVEQAGVWRLAGGMHRLAEALAAVAREKGVELRYETPVAEVLVHQGRASGVRLAGGEELAAEAVVLNADAAAVAAGRLGSAAARALPPSAGMPRSQSAVTWSLLARTRGFPLVHHNVFFSRDYAAEFEDVFDHRRTPREPTVYICAQDRPAADAPAPEGPERLLCLVNAPATGDRHPFATGEIEACADRTFAQLARCGAQVDREEALTRVTTPADFERLFPGTAGALYGPASHGWKASFQRPGARTRLPGLYLAGGSVHPGPGLPMAALSGRLAAAALLSDLGSGTRSRRTATPGGTWTP